MKKGFHVFLFILFAVLMTQSAWATDFYETVTANGQVVEPYCNDNKIVTVASGVTSFVITYKTKPVYYMYDRCEGVVYVNAPNEKTLSFSGEVYLRKYNALYIYDRSGTTDINIYSMSNLSNSNTSYTIDREYTKGSRASVQFSHDGSIDYSNYMSLNVSVHNFHYATVSIPWEKNQPWDYYEIWEKLSFYWDPWEETTSGYYETNPVKFYFGRKIYMKNPRVNTSLWGINVKDITHGNLVPVKVQSSGEYVTGALYPSSDLDSYLMFTMPDGDVAIVPTFDSYSRGGTPRGFGYNLGNESRSVRIDSSIHVYDDGGIDYQYANNFDGYLTVTAHKGQRIKVSGTVATEAGAYDYLEIYEGRKGASTTPICKLYSTETNVAINVPDACKSADSVLTLRFKTDGSNFADGLNLVLSAEDVAYNVILNNNQTSYGTISSDKTVSQPGSIVTLTASPKSGYVLKSVSVINTATNATVATSGGRETGNKITFTMPGGNVKVTPTFVRDTYNIYKSSTSGGTLSVESSAKVGTTVSITGYPQSGYLMRDIEVVAANGDAVTVNGGWFKDNKASFVMPLSDVTVKSTFTNNFTAAAGGLYINMPTTGTANATIPESVKSFKIYDDGGENGDYGSNFNGVLTLTAPEGYVLQVTGSVALAHLEGVLLSGPTNDSLHIYDGAGIESNKITSACETVNDIGKIMSSGRSMTLQFKRKVSSRVGSGLDLTVTLHKLKMDLKKDGNGNFYVDMLTRNATTLDIPESVKSFKVYDDGGKDGDYSSNFNGILTLTAPEGYVLQVTGSVVLERYTGVDYSFDSLYIYDGAGIASNKLYSTYNHERVSDIGKRMSSGHSMTIQFKKYRFGSYVGSGLDLTVTLHKLNMDLEKDGYGNFYVDMLVRNKATLNIPKGVNSFKVYDDGGKDGNYSPNFSGILMLTAPEGCVLQLTGAVDLARFTGLTDYAYDSLYVYDGDGTASNKLYTVRGTVSDVGRYISSGRSLTLRFSKHANSDVASGLNLTVTVIREEHEIAYRHMNQGGSVTSNSPKTAKMYTTVNYAYNYTSGYLVSGIEVVAENGDAVKVNGGWYNDKKVSFIMPPSNVTVKSTYTNNLTVNGGLYINTPYQSKVIAAIPTGVKSFKVYDNGGKDGNYSSYSRDTLVLKAPDGHILRLSGSVATEDKPYDYLRVYNGALIRGDSLFGEYYSSVSGTAKSISGPLLSKGESMTLLFCSDYSANHSGLDLTVEVIPLVNSIAYINKTTGGSVTTNAPKTGTNDSIVNYSYSYNSGYMVSGITAVDADGNSVSVIGGWYNDKKAFFKMPLAAVTVTSSYTDDWSISGGLYINTPYQRKVVASIPTGVKSFKVYDNGGKDGNYSGYSRDTLVLKAPGHILQLSGSVTTENRYDYLRIYNGNGIKADSLFGEYYSSISGTAEPISDPLQSKGESMTLLFNSDYAADYSGIDLSVTLIPIEYSISDNKLLCAIFGQCVSANKSTGYVGDTVYLTAKNNDEKYVLKKFVVNDANKNVVPVIRNTLTEAFFVMPASNVQISEGSFDTDVSADNGLHLDLARNAKKKIDLPSSVKSFNLYDNGGLLDDYSNKSDDTLVITAPAGYHFKMTGKIYTEHNNYDKLSVYDGSSTTARSLFARGSASTGAAYDVGTIETSSNSMTVYFHSDGSVVSSGLDLLVSIVPDSYMISIAKVDNGNVSSKTTTAIAGEKVTLMVNSAEGYYLSGCVVLSDTEGSVTVSYNPADNTASFTMPASPVTITPVFTSVPSINVVSVSGGKVQDEIALAEGFKLNATLTATPNKGFVFKGATVVDADGRTVKIYKDSAWYSNVATFNLTKNVTVTPEFVKEISAADGIFVNMPYEGSSRINIPTAVKSFNVYDDGGKSGNCSRYANGAVVLHVPNGYLLHVDIVSMDAYANDHLIVYDGDYVDVANALLDVSGTEVGSINSSGNSITIHFESSRKAHGFEILVTLVRLGVDIAKVTGGSMTSDKDVASPGESITLTATPADGYLFDGVSVEDEDGNEIALSKYIHWYSEVPENEVSFNMPANAVTVTPKFSAVNDLYVNLPKSGITDVYIPENVTSFKVYDDGGKNGNYSTNGKGTLSLTAPEGYLLELSGSVVTEPPYSSTKIYDFLNVYDGADNTANVLIDAATGSVSVGPVRSTGKNMTFYFESDISTVKSGLDLTVTLVPEDYTITVATVTGGSMTSDKESSIMDGVVTLTAIPNDGYLIDGVEVKDANNNVVALNNNIYWYCGSNNVSFKMPSASVTVIPKFSPINALSVNMPKKLGVMGCDINIPENVTSFKIYDDGGEAGNYSNNANGELWVMFDEKSGNAGLKLSGSVAAPKNGAHLYVTAVTDDAMETFYTFNGSSDGLAEDIGTFINSSTLLIEFSTGNVGSGAGLDLRVDVVKSPGAGVEVVYDDAHVIGNGKLNRWVSITDGVKTSELNIPEDVAVDSVTFIREFKTDNVYNTIVFPFDVKADSLDGVVKVLRFNGFKQKDDESWVVRMKRVWTTDSIGRDIDVNANMPYLVVMDDATLGVRGGVTLRKTVEPIAMAENCNWKFVGTLSYQEWPEGDPLVYGFKDNQFVKAGTNVSVKALRAYLLKPEPKQASGRPSLDGSVNAYKYIAPTDIPDEFDIVEDDDENGENTTVIGRYNTRTGEFRILPSYDIKGRKLNGKPNVHKAYYGKKVIRK